MTDTDKNNVKNVLRMVSEGKISAEEGDSLLDELGQDKCAARSEHVANGETSGLTTRELPSKALLLLIGGATLIALKVDVSFAGWSARPFLLLAGALLITLGVMMLLHSGVLGGSKRILVALVLLLVACAVKILASWGLTQLTSSAWEMVHFLCLFVALILFCLLFSSYCGRMEWWRARRAWYGALFSSAVIYVLPFGLIFVLLLLGAITGKPQHYTSNNFILLAATFALILLPVVLLIRALALTIRAKAECANRRPSRVAQCLAHPACLVFLLLLLMLPVWLLLPAYIHYSTTPTFAKYVESNPVTYEHRPLPGKVEVIEKWSQREVTLGSIQKLPKKGRLPKGLTYITHNLLLELSHGDEILLDMEAELIIQVDCKGEEPVQGIRTKILRETLDSRFHLMIRVAIDTDVPVSDSTEMHDGKPLRILQYPVCIDVALVSGSGKTQYEFCQVRGFKLDDVLNSELLEASVRHRKPMRFPLSPFVFEKPPSSGDGLCFQWRAFSPIRIKQGVPGYHGSSVLIEAVSTDLALTSNYREYSFKMDAKRIIEAKSHGDTSTATTTKTYKNEKKWNSKVW